MNKYEKWNKAFGLEVCQCLENNLKDAWNDLKEAKKTFPKENPQK